MTNAARAGDFDAQPPMPVALYEQMVARVMVGYDLLFTLTGCVLRALAQPNLDLLVVGAGGGAELERFLPDNPDWRLTGVDPSQDMLALAEAKAARLGVSARARLVRGTVAELPDDARFDAATCLLVLHFLPDDGKAALLAGIRAHLRPGAPLLLANGVPVSTEPDLEADLRGAWQQYGELMGMPAEEMAATITRLTAPQPSMATAERYEELLRQAGFTRTVRFFEVLGGGITGWIARS